MSDKGEVERREASRTDDSQNDRRALNDWSRVMVWEWRK